MLVVVHADASPTSFSSTMDHSDGDFDKMLQHPVLEKEESWRLIELAQAGDQDATRQLVVSNLKLVMNIAKKFKGKGLAIEDLFQEGVFGLVVAIDKFDLQRKLKFSTYAMWRIRHSIGRAIETSGKTIRVPSHVTHTVSKINKILGDPATQDRLEELLSVDANKAERLLRAVDPVVAYDQVLEPSHEVEFVDRVILQDRNQVLYDLVNELPGRERTVIVNLFGLGGRTACTLQEMATHFGVSRTMIQIIRDRGLSTLQVRILDEDL